MPCLAYLARVREAYPAVTALGARLVAVGTGSEAQAGELAARGLPFPCLVDATGALYEALGLGRVGWRTALDPATYASYWRAWRAGARRGRVTGDWRRLSGVAVLDAPARRGSNELHGRSVGRSRPEAEDDAVAAMRRSSGRRSGRAISGRGPAGGERRPDAVAGLRRERLPGEPRAELGRALHRP